MEIKLGLVSSFSIFLYIAFVIGRPIIGVCFLCFKYTSLFVFKDTERLDMSNRYEYFVKSSSFL